MNAPSAPIADPPGFAPFRAIACGATLAMVVVSWPLWSGRGEIPRVPFVVGLADLPARWGLVIALGLAMAGWKWRPLLGLALVFLGYLIAGDQNRLQPWAYQFAGFALVMVMAPKPRAMSLARWLVASLYFYSGLSKLDASFVRELGPTFLDAGLTPLGLAPATWPKAARTALVLAMPIWEMVVAVGLMRQRTRRFALVGAIGQHLALLGLLGPWALDQSLNVLIWNGAMIAEDLALFVRPTASGPIRGETVAGKVAAAVVGVAVVLPLGEPIGWFDAWPSHALYASHCERADLLIHDDDADRFAKSVQSRLGPADLAGWRRLDLTGWSRDRRGTPVYPQNRVVLGIAEALAKTPGAIRPVRVVEWGRAGRFDGRRDRVESVGLRAIRRRGDRDRFGAHPEPIAERMP